MDTVDVVVGELPHNLEFIGHVHIENDLGEVLLDDLNAVHPQNMATIIGRALSRSPNYYVYNMVLGNGGASVGSDGQSITYLTPNVAPSTIGLYNQTYFEIVDETAGSDGNLGSANDVSVASGSGTQTVITVTADLAAEQPTGQLATDTGASIENDFAFDELGLQSEDGLLLSHIVFSPILKSANRAISITYSITIGVTNI